VRAIVLFISFCRAGAGAPATQASQRTARDRQLDVESFDHLWKTVYENHFDPTFGGVDWQAARLEFLPRIEQARDRRDVRALMNEMLSRLKLTHLAILPSELYEETDQASGQSGTGATGISVRVVDGHALVVAVDRGSPAEKAGIVPGWEIVRVGPHDVPVGLASMAAELAGRTMKDLALSSAVAGSLGGSLGDTVEVSFLDGQDRIVHRPLRLAEPRGTRFKLGNLPEGRVWLEAKAVGPDIGYIGFNAFVAPGILMPAFNEAMERFMTTRGLVIDLRGNTGGQGDLVAGMAGWLVAEKGRHFGTIQLRNQALKLALRPRPDTYEGRVAILVDGVSLCATEIFAGGLRDLGRARLFGSHTGGAALGGAVETLPNGDRFMYAFANYVTAGGRTIEGHGLEPDVPVTFTRQDLLQGRDPALAAAVSWLSGTHAPPRASRLRFR
jgi:carboxyl-terminal processing protease